jgi:UDP-2,3-diacylglucosamine pyrophosphatase LpxH
MQTIFKGSSTARGPKTRRKPKSRTIILSDCHIGSSEANVAALNKFLLSVECERLVLAGDFFDLWDMDAEDIKHQYASTFKVLRNLLSKETRIDYVIGNHDDTYRKTPLFKPEDGVNIVDKLEMTTPSGYRIAVFHGHEFDHVYNKHEWLYKLLAFANRIGSKIGMNYKKIKKQTCTDLKEQAYGDAVREIHDAAKKKAAKGGFDAVIIGHTHSPTHQPGKEGVPEFLNAGDWKMHNTYVELEGDKLSLHWLSKL